MPPGSWELIGNYAARSVSSAVGLLPVRARVVLPFHAWLPTPRGAGCSPGGHPLGEERLPGPDSAYGAGEVQVVAGAVGPTGLAGDPHRHQQTVLAASLE